MLRPQPASWFEVLAARDDAAVVLETIARTGAVELEARPHAGAPQPLQGIADALARYSELERRYAPYWPVERTPSPAAAAPLTVLDQGIARIHAWSRHAEPLIQSLQKYEKEHSELLLWQRVLDAPDVTLPAAATAPPGPLLVLRLLCLLYTSDAADE